ncbi:peptide chain release factor N(5)-glutamine methyltransferase [Burkholderiaceae bacterium DAT-1]|nr:peptide chain release factor N(5)-glutamine methyltransferase [Burkholderiaceae bacterium DAT-1]
MQHHTLQSLIDLGRQQLGLPALEVRMLVEHATGCTRLQQIAHPEMRVDAERASACRDVLTRRHAGEPVAYLVGEREFFGRSFRVTPAVLIPRPDTELLIELALARLPQSARVIDLGTGSGIIPVTLKLERPDLDVSAIDLSPDALEVARSNADRLNASIRFLQGSWYTPLDAGEQFAMIVSNPPYIANEDRHLSEGDLRFEPAMALTDFSDGLSHIREIVAGARSRLQADGWLLMEHGFDQGEACRAILNAHGFNDVATWTDLAGLDRVTGGHSPRFLHNPRP